jgi:hypothetical protein
MERRLAARRDPNAGESLSRVRLRLGSELVVLNVCDAGLLVEGVARLAPGGRVDVHVVTRTGRVLVRATVARATVSAVRADAIQYRAALMFDQPLDTRCGSG